MMLLDPRHRPDLDLPEPTSPARTLMIASTPRTGSSWLCRALESSAGIGRPKEILNPVAIRDWEVRLGTPLSRARHLPLRGPALALVGRTPWNDHRLRAYIARIRARRSGSSGWFGFKIHDHHAARWFDHAGRDIVGWEPETRWVFVRRRDRHAQAISWVRALQTGRWSSEHPDRADPWYSKAALDCALRHIELGEARWCHRLSRVPYLEVVYEDLMADPATLVARVYAHLHLEAPNALPDVPLRPQADPMTSTWKERWLGQ
jgi:LPS sulfotransferase NodH